MLGCLTVTAWFVFIITITLAKFSAKLKTADNCRSHEWFCASGQFSGKVLTIALCFLYLSSCNWGHKKKELSVVFFFYILSPSVVLLKEIYYLSCKFFTNLDLLIYLLIFGYYIIDFMVFCSYLSLVIFLLVFLLILLFLLYLSSAIVALPDPACSFLPRHLFLLLFVLHPSPAPLTPHIPHISFPFRSLIPPSLRTPSFSCSSYSSSFFTFSSSHSLSTFSLLFLY